MFYDQKAFADYREKTRRKSAFIPEGAPKPYLAEQGFFDALGNAYQSGAYSGKSSSYVNAYADEIEQDLDALRQYAKKDGFDVHNGFRGASAYLNSVNDSFFGGVTDAFKKKEEEYWEFYDNLRYLYPQAGARSREEITAAIREKSEKLKEKAAGEKTWLGEIGGFIGNTAGVMTDPVNLAAIPLSFNPASLTGRMAVGAVANMLTEAAIQPSVKKFHNNLGVEYTVGDGVQSVVQAGVGGAAVPVLGAVGKKGYGFVKNLVARHGLKTDIKIRAADRAIAEAELIEKANPYYPDDIAGQAHFEQTLNDVTQKVLQGEAVQDGVKQLRYIDETIAGVMGKKPGFIQLKAANVHPAERHLKDIQKVGFKDVEEFAGFVADHFDGIYKGNIPGRYLFSVSNERLRDLNLPAGNHSNALVVEALLIKDSGVFDIVTASPRPRKFFEKKKNLLSERAPSNQTVSSSPYAYLGQKQAYENNIIHDGKNVQPVNAGGYNLTTQYDIVDLSELKTSDNAGYPAALQPRDRTRQASADQVGEIMRHLDPERLGRHTDADRGAPVVGPDGFVESGNGRTMAIRRAYAENPQAAARYRRMVENEAALIGKDVSKMKQPVFIRRRLTDLSEAERLEFVQAANRSSSLLYSAAEHAALDADRLSADILDLYEGGDLRSVKNAEFVRRFRSAAVSNEEAAGFQTSDGRLSRAGEERIQAALFAKAYGDRELASLLFEDENNIKSIGRGMLEGAADFARLKEDIKAGRVGAEYDITPDIVEAVNVVRITRETGENISDYIAQTDMFSGDRSYLRGILQTFFRDENFKRSVSAEKVGEALKQYAQAARAQNKNQLAMFDITRRPGEIIDDGLKRIHANDMIGGDDAKAAAAFFEAKKSVEMEKIDDELLAAKKTVEAVPESHRFELEAQIKDSETADKMLAEATTCRR